MASDGGPVFPIPSQTIDDGVSMHSTQGYFGMSRRDYFAAKAMQSLILKVPLHDRLGEHGIAAPTVDEIHGVRRDVAQSARDYADAMIEALDAPASPGETS